MSATAVDVVVVYKDGVLKPEGDARFEGALQESRRYKAHLEPVSADLQVEDDPTGWKTIDELVGFIKDGPTEPIGRDHDKYLYGYLK
jgi:hypothetical protein